jgi:hypothetical protein
MPGIGCGMVAKAAGRVADVLGTCLPEAGTHACCTDACQIKQSAAAGCGEHASLKLHLHARHGCCWWCRTLVQRCMMQQGCCMPNPAAALLL